MHLRRTAVIVTAVVVAVIIVVIAGMTFMGLLGQDDPTKKDDPAAYTKAFVQKAIERYERDGRQATIDYYNDPENIDEQWYGVIVDEDGYTIAHYNPERRGIDPGERVDATGYFFGGRRDGGHRGGTLGGVHPPESRDRTEPEEAHMGGEARRSDLRFGMVRGIESTEPVMVS